jgi:uncharacterized membrane protein YbhN (UPF0104 family)
MRKLLMTAIGDVDKKFWTAIFHFCVMCVSIYFVVSGCVTAVSHTTGGTGFDETGQPK